MINEITQSNEEKVSEIFKSWFTEEELKIMEERYNKMLQDEKEKRNESISTND